ncbi:CheB methylesterase domain-containing protein [Alicyclobacillus macrosporangiidus]|uniref:CheB methylesterase domain-containing protein n=1 Tax=Alicyclobacillus macrosporangiidus TaxID=392015 RepID=UPI001587CFEB|nr:CheB methylesterase domain-containing protein [Alicyclobacillus macrosporangiidus]
MASRQAKAHRVHQGGQPARWAPGVVVIGCSTGGPAALARLLPDFPADFPVPVVVLQHMPAGFTRPLAERLNRLCALMVKEGEDGEILRPGTAYVAPSGLQTTLAGTAGGVALRVWPEERAPLEYASDEALAPLYKPCIDITLASAAEVFGGRVLAVILTGMGKDGLAGCRAVKSKGGRVVAEAASSAVVYGMPRVVAEAGLADGQAPVGELYSEIVRWMGGGTG